MRIKVKQRISKFPNWKWDVYDNVKYIHVGKYKTLISFDCKNNIELKKFTVGIKTSTILSIELI